MTRVMLETVAPIDREPVAHPKPVTREEYAASTCPICFLGLQERKYGSWCPRCRGWLVEETREGRLVHALWQGRP